MRLARRGKDRSDSASPANEVSLTRVELRGTLELLAARAVEDADSGRSQGWTKEVMRALIHTLLTEGG